MKIQRVEVECKNCSWLILYSLLSTFVGELHWSLSSQEIMSSCYLLAPEDCW